MLVEIWSDVVCPWCYLGKRRFEAALARFEHADEVTVRWRSFELDPGAPSRPSRPMAEQIAGRYGRPVEAVRVQLASMDRMAAAEGLDYRLEDTTGGNTFDAHRLAHLAADAGLGPEMEEALFSAYFGQRRPVSDHQVLSEVAAGVGLDPAAVAEVLGGDRYGDAVRHDEAEATELGVTGVPFFLVERAWGVPGAQDAATHLDVLRRAYGRRRVG